MDGARKDLERAERDLAVYAANAGVMAPPESNDGDSPPPEGTTATRLAQLNAFRAQATADRSEEHTSELQSLMRISYAVFCLKKKNTNTKLHKTIHTNRTNINKQTIFIMT